MEALSRRAYLTGSLAFGFLVLAGCSSLRGDNPADEPQPALAETSRAAEPSSPEPDADMTVGSVQIRVTINSVDFTATLDAGEAGQDLLARLPLTLQIQELHGNEKCCYTDEPFDEQEQVPATIEAGELMVFPGDCLVLFYETFANDGWAYQRVGSIDDAAGLAATCGPGTATVTLAAVEP